MMKVFFFILALISFQCNGFVHRIHLQKQVVVRPKVCIVSGSSINTKLNMNSINFVSPMVPIIRSTSFLKYAIAASAVALTAKNLWSPKNRDSTLNIFGKYGWFPVAGYFVYLSLLPIIKLRSSIKSQSIEERIAVSNNFGRFLQERRQAERDETAVDDNADRQESVHGKDVPVVREVVSEDINVSRSDTPAKPTNSMFVSLFSPKSRRPSDITTFLQHHTRDEVTTNAHTISAMLDLLPPNVVAEFSWKEKLQLAADDATKSQHSDPYHHPELILNMCNVLTVALIDKALSLSAAADVAKALEYVHEVPGLLSRVYRRLHEAAAGQLSFQRIVYNGQHSKKPRALEELYCAYYRAVLSNTDSDELQASCNILAEVLGISDKRKDQLVSEMQIVSQQELMNKMLSPQMWSGKGGTEEAGQLMREVVALTAGSGDSDDALNKFLGAFSGAPKAMAGARDDSDNVDISGLPPMGDAEVAEFQKMFADAPELKGMKFSDADVKEAMKMAQQMMGSMGGQGGGFKGGFPPGRRGSAGGSMPNFQGLLKSTAKAGANDLLKSMPKALEQVSKGVDVEKLLSLNPKDMTAMMGSMASTMQTMLDKGMITKAALRQIEQQLGLDFAQVVQMMETMLPQGGGPQAEEMRKTLELFKRLLKIKDGGGR